MTSFKALLWALLNVNSCTLWCIKTTISCVCYDYSQVLLVHPEAIKKLLKNVNLYQHWTFLLASQQALGMCRVEGPALHRFPLKTQEKQNMLTESCPGRTWGASRRAPGLVGDITEIEGLSIFWDSKELEPKTIWETHELTIQNLDNLWTAFSLNCMKLT